MSPGRIFDLVVALGAGGCLYSFAVAFTNNEALGFSPRRLIAYVRMLRRSRDLHELRKAGFRLKRQRYSGSLCECDLPTFGVVAPAPIKLWNGEERKRFKPIGEACFYCGYWHVGTGYAKEYGYEGGERVPLKVLYEKRTAPVEPRGYRDDTIGMKEDHMDERRPDEEVKGLPAGWYCQSPRVGEMFGLTAPSTERHKALVHYHFLGAAAFACGWAVRQSAYGIVFSTVPAPYTCAECRKRAAECEGKA